jgi:diketogulonate reductase-like aldo/keto reductase
MVFWWLCQFPPSSVVYPMGDANFFQQNPEMSVATLFGWVLASHTPNPIPFQQLSAGGKLPLLVMGGFGSTTGGRASNYSAWLELVGPGAGIDTAYDYHTQVAIAAAIASGNVARNDVFLTTKIPCGGYDGGPEPMTAAAAQDFISTNLQQLNTTYLDLLLLHHTCKTEAEVAMVWEVFEQAKQNGSVKAIGVSNFNSTQLATLAAVATEPIEVLQCHFAVGEMDWDTIRFCQQHGIALESFGTLHARVQLDEPVVQAIAAKHDVSTAVVMYRYISQLNISVVTGSSNVEYDREDIGMFSLVLDGDDREQLDGLQQKGSRTTCSDCDSAPCQACQSALKAVGCTPYGKEGCMACAAARHTNPVLLAGCGGQDWMLYKACYAM